MTDENPTPAPEQQPALPQPTPQPKLKVANSSIEKLPDEVRADIDQYLKLNNPSATHRYIKEKYVEQFPHLKNMSARSVYLYAKKHQIKTLRETILETEITKTPPEFLKFMDTVGNPASKLEDKRSAYLEIYNYYQRIGASLEATQVNFKDPQVYAVITRIKSEQAKIVDTLIKYDERVMQVNQQDILDEVDIVIGLCTTAIINSYKESHPDQARFSDFMAKYKDRIKELFRSYKATKENLKANPININ